MRWENNGRVRNETVMIKDSIIHIKPVSLVYWGVSIGYVDKISTFIQLALQHLTITIKKNQEVMFPACPPILKIIS